MTSQTPYSVSPDNGLSQDPLQGWLGALLALALAAVIASAAYLVAQPVVVNQAAGWLAQSVPSAAVQGVAGYLAAHSEADGAESAPSATGAAAPNAGCLVTQNVAPAGGAPAQPQP